MQENDTNTGARAKPETEPGAKSRPDGRDPFRRYRLSIPLDDKEVIDWLEAQSNPSFSVRTVIKAAIKDSGIRDVTCGIQDVRVLLGLARIAEAYQVGVGAIPASASTLVDRELQASRERLAAAGTQGPTDAAPPVTAGESGPADAPHGGQRPAAPAKTAPVPAQAPTAPRTPAYPAPSPGGRTEQVFMDPENMLNNM